MADWRERAERAEAECGRLRSVVADREKTVDEIHEILGRVIFEAQEKEREYEETVARLGKAA